MGLQDVKNEIVEEADARADVIIEEAEAKKEAMLEEARDEAEDIIRDAEEDAEQEVEALRKKKLSSARMEAKKKRLNVRESLLEETFDAFRERIHNLDDDTEAELIEHALERLSDDVEIGTVHTAEKHSDLAKSYGDFEERDIDGVIVETADGARRFNMQFDAVADRIIEENKKAVSEVLFKK